MFEKPLHFNSGYGQNFMPIDIGHDEYCAVIEPETAFWNLVKKEKLGDTLCDPAFFESYQKNAESFQKEMADLRFNLLPSAVYFNPTDRCNLNCEYCYIPKEIRKDGQHMSQENIMKSLAILKDYFATTVPKGRKPQIVFHGAEPMMNKEAMFAGIAEFANDFNFGIQTNATLLEDADIDFIKKNKIGLGISIDGPDAVIGDAARKTWNGDGCFQKASSVIEKLKDHPGFNVICTITTQNMERLPDVVDYFHENGVNVCMLNILRCTQENSRSIKPDDEIAAKYYLKALDRSFELYEKTGRKLIVANFANILISILAPTARRLMCDISPCGGGRCFFALAANGDMFPCSEFIGVPEFNGGNLFKDDIPSVLETEAFKRVTGRKVEDIKPCASCAIRHFCGSPCPAEAHTMNGGLDKRGAFCQFYEEQVRYAFRLIADDKDQAFLFDGWDDDTQVTVDTERFL